MFAIVSWIYSWVTFVCINNINLFWTNIESSSSFSFRQRHVVFFRNKFGSVIMSTTHCRTDKKWISMRKQCGKKVFHFLSYFTEKIIILCHGQIHWYYSHRSQKKLPSLLRQNILFQTSVFSKMIHLFHWKIFRLNSYSSLML